MTARSIETVKSVLTSLYRVYYGPSV